jgi:hypothetical protein
MKIKTISVVETDPENRNLSVTNFSADSEGAAEAQKHFEETIREYGVEPTDDDVTAGKWISEGGWGVWLVNFQPYV